MSKPKTQSVDQPGPENKGQQRERGASGGQEPLSGSKRTKQANHTRHHNPQG